MGNQKSKATKDQGGGTPQSGQPAPPTSQGQVQMRQKKGKKKKQERPASDPGVAGTSVEMYPNFHMQMPRDSQDISGRNQAPAQVGHLNPLDASSEPAIDYDTGVPSRDSDENKNKLDTYDQSLDQVLGVWPEYGSLKGISVSKLSKEVVATIQQVYKRLFEQHTLIKELSEDKHEAVQSLRELQDESKAHAQRLQRRETELTQLRDEMRALKQEMRHRGNSADSPRYDSTGTPRSQRSSQDGNQNQAAAGGGYEDSTWDRNRISNEIENSPVPENAQLQKLRNQERQGILQATPLLTAEGIAGSKAALKRTPSALKPVVRNSPVAKVEPIYDNMAAGRSNYPAKSEEDLAAKVKRLETALERERREKHALRSIAAPEDRLPTKEGSSLQQSIYIDYVLDRYARLEADALDKIYQTFNSHLGHVSEQRKYRFLGAIMMRSFEVSKEVVHRVQENLAILLLNPARPDLREFYTHAPPGDRGPMSAGPALGGSGTRFEFPHKGKGTSRLASRAVAAGEVPENIVNQVLLFLENMSRYADLSRLAEDVVDTLCQEFPECTTPGLLNQKSFIQFLDQCCRLAYQMNVMVPPLYVTTEIDWRFEEKFHVGHYKQNISSNAEIDFFIWPILFTKKHGDVLHKGRVAVKS